MNFDEKVIRRNTNCYKWDVQDDPDLTAVVRSRQLHIYRNGKKVLVLAGKAAPKIIREDKINDLLE